MMRKLLIVMVLSLSLQPTGESWALEYTASSLRDPFTDPLDAGAKQFGVLGSDLSIAETMQAVTKLYQVQGLVWNTPRPQAVVNQRVVDVGDNISGAKVVRIYKEGVEIEVDRKRYSLTMDGW